MARQLSTLGPRVGRSSLLAVGGARRRTLRTIAADIVVILGAIALIWVLVEVGKGMNAHVDLGNASGTIDTDPAKLPYYAARSLLRMFIGLLASLIFTFVFAVAAARSRRARAVLLPILDILQSVPVLGFLSITVTPFIALFPGSEMGLECAAIFAIFTSQAWNMAFSLYYSLASQPRDLAEAAVDLRLSRWQRFWRLDLPSGAIPLVWNSMMSFGGAWFFLTASEAVTVAGKSYALPGVGAYVASAAQAGRLTDVWWAVLTMVVVVVAVNVLFWSPLTAWAEKFRVEDSESGREPRSLVLTVLRRSRVSAAFGWVMAPVTAVCDKVFGAVFGRAGGQTVVSTRRRRSGDAVFALAVAATLSYAVFRVVQVVLRGTGGGEVWHVFLLGAATMSRVVVLIIVCTLIWVPVGVLIGLDPRMSRFLSPILQIAASFPANFLFPMVGAVFLAWHLSLDVGGIVLMALGTQWYILFNVIAGASAIPNDLLEAARDMNLTRALKWRKVLLPAIFGSLVTGGITAAGGAWNASIVAEVLTYHGRTYHAFGLGDYIATWTASAAPGHGAHLLLGIVMMCVFVVATNAVFWRRLYALAARRFSY
ncbi:ABC transporter permease subunit [Gordonia sp. (in: high G+C Gram-positive bacteria)]|uniref:ABC transporter permease n=1 Tax=Gordonia sp. (in: high G+C Gram-positive bacteria) TaxID=84139 RepID=UPI002607123C|nr:ABC transporter permease subunit [Gordonia sp. (in: high G+C Gram-positive bacteria)]